MFVICILVFPVLFLCLFFLHSKAINEIHEAGFSEINIIFSLVVIYWVNLCSICYCITTPCFSCLIGIIFITELVFFIRGWQFLSDVRYIDFVKNHSNDVHRANSLLIAILTIKPVFLLFTCYAFCGATWVLFKERRDMDAFVDNRDPNLLRRSMNLGN